HHPNGAARLSREPARTGFASQTMSSPRCAVWVQWKWRHRSPRRYRLTPSGSPPIAGAVPV
ncbi:MAG: hypothetical protein ACXVB5_20380, partial [Isosphaeraceae bacterium]